MIQKPSKEIPSRNSSSANFLASTQIGEKGWGLIRPQAFRRKFSARLAQNGNSLSQPLPLSMDSFGMESRGSGWEMPCARRAVVVVCEGVILP